MDSDFVWLGTERCELLEAIMHEIQSFSSLSAQEKQTLTWAIAKLMETYGCNF
jgi:hypothetical protein